MAVTVLNDATIESTDDIMDAIHTFLTSTLTNSWTSNGINTTTNVAGFSTGNLFVQFQWTGSQIDISQSTASAGTATFGGETGDSGFDSNVVFPATVSDAELWVFANETATAEDRYAYAVVEFARDNRFLHFGFGQIGSADKFWSWTGGAFKYGAEFAIADSGHEPWDTAHRGPLLDSAHVATAASGNLHTMRASGLRDQNASSIWLAFSEGNPATIDDTNDGNGNPVSTGRAFGRYGPAPSMASFQRGSANSATAHLIPIRVCFSPTDNQYMPLGRMPGVRIVNMGNIQPKDTITIGSDDWQVFPWGQKLTLASDQNELATRNLGIAYLAA